MCSDTRVFCRKFIFSFVNFQIFILAITHLFIHLNIAFVSQDSLIGGIKNISSFILL